MTTLVRMVGGPWDGKEWSMAWPIELITAASNGAPSLLQDGAYRRDHEGHAGPWPRALLYRWEPAREEGAST